MQQPHQKKNPAWLKTKQNNFWVCFYFISLYS